MQREQIKYKEDCFNLLPPIQHFECLKLEPRPINITPIERPEDSGLGLVIAIIFGILFLILTYKNSRSVK